MKRGSGVGFARPKIWQFSKFLDSLKIKPINNRPEQKETFFRRFPPIPPS